MSKGLGGWLPSELNGLPGPLLLDPLLLLDLQRKQSPYKAEDTICSYVKNVCVTGNDHKQCDFANSCVASLCPSQA